MTANNDSGAMSEAQMEFIERMSDLFENGVVFEPNRDGTGHWVFRQDASPLAKEEENLKEKE